MDAHEFNFSDFSFVMLLIRSLCPQLVEFDIIHLSVAVFSQGSVSKFGQFVFEAMVLPEKRVFLEQAESIFLLCVLADDYFSLLYEIDLVDIFFGLYDIVVFLEYSCVHMNDHVVDKVLLTAFEKNVELRYETLKFFAIMNDL
jgi:hypothetical protein